MTVTLHWWYLPVAMAIFGFYRLTRPRKSDYDFVTGLDGLVIIGGALCVTLGHVI